MTSIWSLLGRFKIWKFPVSCSMFPIVEVDVVPGQCFTLFCNHMSIASLKRLASGERLFLGCLWGAWLYLSRFGFPGNDLGRVDDGKAPRQSCLSKAFLASFSEWLPNGHDALGLWKSGGRRKRVSARCRHRFHSVVGRLFLRRRRWRLDGTPAPSPRSPMPSQSAQGVLAKMAPDRFSLVTSCAH